MSATTPTESAREKIERLHAEILGCKEDEAIESSYELRDEALDKAILVDYLQGRERHHIAENKRLADECEKLRQFATKNASKVETLVEENAELNQLFDLQHRRIMECESWWRKAVPGRELMKPDLGKLLEWLSKEIITLRGGGPE